MQAARRTLNGIAALVLGWGWLVLGLAILIPTAIAVIPKAIAAIDVIAESRRRASRIIKNPPNT